MAILCIESEPIATRWRIALTDALPEVEVRIWPDAGERADIEMVLLWDELEVLAELPNLRAAVVLGAGVDHIFASDHAIPSHLQVVRLNDPSITSQMIEYVTLAVLARQRRWDDYRTCQREGRYDELPADLPADVTIGVLGLGELGSAVARTLAGFGYRLCGWSRTLHSLDGVECHAGAEGLRSMAAKCDLVVCLLPLTASTKNILDAEFFAVMKTGAYLINAARGDHLVEADLIAAIDGGHLSGATLDVQREEPLPPGHPFWDHPKIVITPHIATFTLPEPCAAQVAENYRRLRAGEPLLNTIDLERQY